MQDKGDTMELRSVRRWSLTALVIAAVVLDIAIVVWPNWAETLFGIDTDAGSGSFETAVAVALTLVTVVAALATVNVNVVADAYGVIADLDHARIAEIRESLPALAHRIL